MMCFDRHQIMYALILMLLPITGSAHPMVIDAKFDARLERSNAIILFHSQDERHAKRVLEILEHAIPLVAQRMPHSGGKVTAYLYGTDEEMSQGLSAILGYSPVEVNAVLKVGISEQRNNTLHLHPKTAKWGNFLSHAIIDEHTHGVIQNKYGIGPAISATWIEEGLTSYLAHEVLVDELKEFEDTYPERRFKVAFKALIFGKLPNLDDISTRAQWYNNINESNEAWNIQYALAYFSVSHLVKNYGFESILNILSDIQKGMSYHDSLVNVTGITLDDLEKNVRFSLLYTGFTQLYMNYTLLILFLLLVIGSGLVGLSYAKRKKNAYKTNAV